jgi:hypothetical protein
LNKVNWFEHWDWSAIIVSYDPRAEMEAVSNNWAGKGLGMNWLARLRVDWRVMCWQCRLGGTGWGEHRGTHLARRPGGNDAEQECLFDVH